jgi:hypothetical protein
MTPLENYEFPMKPSVTELRENCIPSRRQYLRNLRIIYGLLHDVAFLMNSNYAFSLLYAMTWVFVSIISRAIYALQFKDTDFLHVLHATIWISFSVTLVTMMTVSCSLAANECNHSHVIVQKIMLHDDIDTEVMTELKKMFTQFEVMTIGFSACGMYKIDLTLLCGIIGATLSYVIIFSAL